MTEAADGRLVVAGGSTRLLRLRLRRRLFLYLLLFLLLQLLLLQLLLPPVAASASAAAASTAAARSLKKEEEEVTGSSSAAATANTSTSSSSYVEEQKQLIQKQRVYHQRRARNLDVLAKALRERVDEVRRRSSEQLDLIFLIDASSSVGESNFRSELNFVRKLLIDFELEQNATRLALVTFAGRGQIQRHVDQVSSSSRYLITDRFGKADKCRILTRRLDGICYTGGGTYTYGALMEAFSILENSRTNSEKLVFLVTDGFSNGEDPRLAASLLKALGATIFTFGTRTGNIDELNDIASSPSCTHSYLLDNFAEFEALARKALHRDLKAGSYTLVEDTRECSRLCGTSVGSSETCCDPLASCSCGITSGHYACICAPGYFGNGLLGSCRPCPNGTYGWQNNPYDLSVSCVSCPDANHITLRIPALSSRDCICNSGFIGERGICLAITCPKLKVPENGYFVKANDCNNVVNAACGIRCRIGFHLTGDSIRLCSKNGSWTGEDTQCLLKTCPTLKAPANGRIRCEHENTAGRVNDKTAQPIDTRCRFKCESGFQLRGSKVRNCLPLARWDGLKTTCKPIYCEPLSTVANAEIQPKPCLGPRKLAYGTNCTITCRKGYKLEGPRSRTCIGRHGSWSKRHSVSRCIDKTRPVIKCPANITLNTLPGKNYAYANWTIPQASDNSGMECNVWSRPHISLPWKVHIGRHIVKYVAQDVSGNKARCSFSVNVIDKEPPVIENCANNQLYLTGSEKNLKEFNWDEPLIYDNSGLPVKINKTFRSTTGPFTQGRHSISYDVMDKYHNVAKCYVNLTILDACEILPKPLNGKSECTNFGKSGKRCSLSCNPGYAFAFDVTVGSVGEGSKSQGVEIVAICSPSNHSWNLTSTIDCSPVKAPTSVSQEGRIILEGDTVNCDNTELLNTLSKSINESYNFNVIDICTNRLECNVNNELSCEEFVARVTRDITHSKIDNRKRKKYDGQIIGGNSEMKDSKNSSRTIEIKIKFIAKIVEENRKNPELGIAKIKDRLQLMSKSGELNLLDESSKKEINKLASNLKILFNEPKDICDIGSVLKKSGCVKCPAGTFHNLTRLQCQACHYGEYQSESGSSKCHSCPVNYFTRRMHSRSIAECIPSCQPGHYSRRRQQQQQQHPPRTDHHHQQQHPISTNSLGPCISCEIGSYQNRHGQSQCLACPSGTSTESRGSLNLADCLPIGEIRTGGGGGGVGVGGSSRIDPCASSYRRSSGSSSKVQLQHQPMCMNRGVCIKERDGFACQCRDHYVGSRCEIFVNPCLSSPCSNAGQCILKNTSDNQWSYFCACKPGYTGKYCETLINECSYSPCRNGGTCLSTDIDITCTCRDGYEGDFCELAVDHCASSPCENGSSSCISANGTWNCICRPGYLGLRCDLLPCDWLPCKTTQICVNLVKINTDKADYRCDCPEGFIGDECKMKIDHCDSSPCLNNGTCTSNLSSYKCNCSTTFTGSRCETELSRDYVMYFPRSSITDYSIVKGPLTNITELTVCFWMRSADTVNYGTVVSYANAEYDNAFTVTDYNGYVLYINGERIITDVGTNDGYWHFVCVSWENKLDSWQVYVDGILKDNGTLLSKNLQIFGEGTFVIGQEQDEIGGGFSESESFQGKLYLLDIWDKASESDFINYLSSTCDKYQGSLISWAELQNHIRGNVEIEESSFCQGCPTPIAPFQGYVNVSENGLEVIYSCETGYEFRVDLQSYKTFSRKCLKYGRWEDSQVPNCVRISCPNPEYFLRGWIQGKSYLYGDKITYHCNDGHDLRGNSQRVCKSNGKWSGIAPFCIGVTCKNLLAPNHGDIEYIIDEHDRDDLSILQVGHKLEFKCDPGYFINGEKILTCLPNGSWDFKRPSCISMGCEPPKEIKNGYIVANITSDLDAPLGLLSKSDSSPIRDFYFYGDVIVVACMPGFKFQANHNLVAEFKLQCSANGNWTGHLPNCVPLRCSWPESLDNGRIYLLHQSEVKEKLIETPLEQIPDNSSFIIKDEEYENTYDSDSKNQTDESSDKNLIVNTQIKIVCEDGYEISQSKSILITKCSENETWIPQDINCKPIRCPKENHPLIGLFDKNSTINKSDEFSSKVEIGQINYTMDRWRKVEETFELVVEGDGSYGDNASLRCKTLSVEDAGELFELTWRCEKDGVWRLGIELSEDNKTAVLTQLIEEADSLCTPHARCETPEAPAHGYVKYDDTGEDNVTSSLRSITFKCDEGYSLIGAEKLSCLENGTWSSAPTCQPMTCAKPPQVPYAELQKGQINSETLVFGSIVYYQCVTGYQISGQLSSQCLANGQWSTIGKCTRISCGKPPLIPGASIQGDSYFYQDRLIYICPGGKFRDMIVCDITGNWSTLPKCT